MRIDILKGANDLLLVFEEKRPVHQRYITEEQSSEKPPPNAVHAALCKSQTKTEREEVYIQSQKKRVVRQERVLNVKMGLR